MVTDHPRPPAQRPRAARTAARDSVWAMVAAAQAAEALQANSARTMRPTGRSARAARSSRAPRALKITAIDVSSGMPDATPGAAPDRGRFYAGATIPLRA